MTSEGHGCHPTEEPYPVSLGEEILCLRKTAKEPIQQVHFESDLRWVSVHEGPALYQVLHTRLTHMLPPARKI